MKGRAIEYSDAERAWLCANRLMPISVYHTAFRAAFDRIDVSAVNLHSLRKRMGWKTGRTGQFKKGAVPFNKGKPMPYHPNSAATRFKKGERRGLAVRLYKPIGTERLSKEGYLERKIHDGMPLQSRWRAVHILEWESANGPLPAGFCLKCLDGNRLNTSPHNWEAIHRGVLARLNGGRHKRRISYDAAPPELKPTVMAMAKLQHAASSARSSERSA